jgi:hypothetical protein
MVDMGMRQDERIEFRRREREWAVIEFLLRLRALEHAAIDQNARPFGFEGDAGSCHGVGRAVESKVKWHGGGIQTRSEDPYH